MNFRESYDYVFHGIRPNPLAGLPDFSPVPLPIKGDRWTRWGEIGTITDVTCGGRWVTWQPDSGEAAVTVGLSDFLGQATFTPSG